MKSQHTAGPWRVRARADKGLSIKAGELCLIARVARQPTSYKENALLIAASPDLYLVLEALHTAGLLESLKTGDEFQRGMYDLAVAALNKAKGLV